VAEAVGAVVAGAVLATVVSAAADAAVVVSAAEVVSSSSSPQAVARRASVTITAAGATHRCRPRPAFVRELVRELVLGRVLDSSTVTPPVSV
jgi:hypothetical protein